MYIVHQKRIIPDCSCMQIMLLNSIRDQFFFTQKILMSISYTLHFHHKLQYQCIKSEIHQQEPNIQTQQRQPLFNVTMYQNHCLTIMHTPVVSDLKFEELQQFTCLMYCSKTKCLDVNSLRYEMFVKKGTIESHQLSPCKDTRYKYCSWACYQAGISIYGSNALNLSQISEVLSEWDRVLKRKTDMK